MINSTIFVAVCFFGQVKRFEQVDESVKKHVLGVLQAKNYQFDIYIHTYNQSVFNNPRNREYDVPLDPTSLQTALNVSPSAVIYDSIQEADNWMDARFLAKNGDPWPDNPRLSIVNYVRQLHSLKRVTKLWLPARLKYTYILYLRPDALFLNDLDLPSMSSGMDENVLVTPGFACNGHLWNDRMAYGRPTVMEAYGLRGDRLVEYLSVDSHRRPHAETFLQDYMTARNVTNLHSRTLFQRMRANGRVDHRDTVLALRARLLQG
jgi:hypothetical protein